ncbi:MAG: iron-sulfur cluster assembly accessory protein [bacterium]|nr:iron-sulfur cluster assembly accessory protein [bacterium]
MINLTETAAGEVRKIIDQHLQGGPDPAAGDGGAPNGRAMYLRVGVTGGGCSGFKQTLDLTETLGENDEQFEHHGVKVICDSKSHIYLDGSTIDFKSTTMGSGFVFDIPSATGQCGCGSSFSA